MDLSVNEISVHYLGHSKLETDIAFDKINDLFLEDSKDIYTRFQQAFGSLVLQFKDYLKNDYQEISEGFNEKTLFSLQLQQHQIWLNAYKEFFQKSFISINSSEENNSIQIEFEDLDSFISDLFEENSGKLCKFHKEDQAILIESLKDLLNDFSNAPKTILSEKFTNLFLQQKDFEKTLNLFLNTVLEVNRFQNEKLELDFELEELNKYRKLPFPLEESEKYFYYPFRTVTQPFLEDVYKKYLSNLETHDHDSSMSQDELDEYNQSENNDSLETYNEEEEELKLSKKNSDMEEIPVLKKEKSNKSNRNKMNKLNGLEQIVEDRNEEIKFFLLNGKALKDWKPTKSVKSIRSNCSKKSKESKKSWNKKKMSEELDDNLDLPQLKLK